MSLDKAILHGIEHRKSYSIKFAGDEQIVNCYEVGEDDFNQKDIEDKYYLPNKMKTAQLHFLQYWDEVDDDNCLDMKVLQPARLVFVGFENERKKKEGR